VHLLQPSARAPIMLVTHIPGQKPYLSHRLVPPPTQAAVPSPVSANSAPRLNIPAPMCAIDMVH
jgi:hypothetical protein